MLTQSEATQLKGDIGVLIDALTTGSQSRTGSAELTTAAASISGSAVFSSSTGGNTIGPGVVQMAELVVQDGETLTIVPGTEFVRTDVQPDPNQAGGGIKVMPGGRLVATRTTSDPPILIRSANPTGYRGHLMCQGDMELDGVEIRDFGRTTNDPLDPVSNPIARYACHWHQAGDRPTSRVENCTIWDNETTPNHRYGIVVHGTNYVTVRSNFVHHKAGCGIYVEDGSEHDNLFDGNTVEDIYGTGQRPDANGSDKGRIGCGFYLTNGWNRVINNTTRRDTGRAGFLYFCNYSPILEFSNNIAEDCDTGLEPWYVGDDALASVFANFTAHNCARTGYRHYPCKNVTFSNLALDNCLFGFDGGDYAMETGRLENSTISGCIYGIFCSTRNTPDFPIVNCNLVDNVRDIYLKTLYHNSGWTGCWPRVVRIDNCLLSSPTKIEMVSEERNNGHYLLLDQVFVTNYQQVPGNDFQVYYNEQAASAIVPEATGPLAKGAEEPGLTNQQHWDTYGSARAGAVMPADAVTRAGIIGMVK